MRLGEFELLRPLASGGMAEVWQVCHVHTGQPAALKVMTINEVDQGRFISAFRQEVRAIAGLNHPHIVKIYDQGEVGGEAAAWRGEGWREGAPWLAMELASGGTLAQVPGPLSFDLWVQSLLQVLDALAYAHARGIVHLDLKPANVLRRSGGLDQLILSDFGIALALEPDAEVGLPRAGSAETGVGVAGTPAFMAPEQFAGAWRDFGPWTDLYALGCMAWRLAFGRTPFAGATYDDLMRQHYHEAPPPMPEGGELHPAAREWISTLLNKSPQRRFSCAADAAAALSQLGPWQRPRPGRPRPLNDEDKGSKDGTFPADNLATLLLEPDPVGGITEMTQLALPGDQPDIPARGVTPVVLGQWPRCRLPPSWQTPDSGGSQHGPPLGLSLFGMRPLPVVDRDDVRNSLWSALHDVHHQGTPRVFLLRGGAGSGKSAMVRWLVQRAHEVGGAWWLKAPHSPTRGPGEGLTWMLAHQLRLTGLGLKAARWRLERELERLGIFDVYDARLLFEQVSPILSGGEAPGGSPSAAPLARYGAIVRYLRALTLERPRILWLDDIQWGPDTLNFLKHFLQFEAKSHLPVLVVATVREEAIQRAPLEQTLLQKVVEQGPLVSLSLPPLEPQHISTLVSQMLPLEPDLCGQIVARTGGNPLFVVQLVRDWVARDILVPGPAGFTFPPGQVVNLPADLHAVWMDRVQLVLEGQGPEAGLLLELAAALGIDFDVELWAEVAREGGWELRTPLLEVLLDGQLLSRAEGQEGGGQHRVSLAHGLLRESLEYSSRLAGRWVGHNLMCARVLGRRIGQGQGGLQEPLGLHLLAAECPEEAAAPLLEAARLRWRRSEYDEALRLLAMREKSLVEAGLSLSAASFGQGWWLQAHILCHGGQLPAARLVAERCLANAEQDPQSELKARALSLLGKIAREQFSHPEAISFLEAARRRCSLLPDPSTEVDTLRLLATCYMEQGDMARAEPMMARALTLARSLDDTFEIAQCLRGLGRLARSRAQGPLARRCFEEALLLYERMGNVNGMADCVQPLGYITAFMEGDLERAEPLLRRALLIHERIGAQVGIAGSLSDLGDLLRARGRPEDAIGYYDRAILILQAAGTSYHVAVEVMKSLAMLDLGRVAEAQDCLSRVPPGGPPMPRFRAVYWMAELRIATDCTDMSLWDCAMDALTQMPQPIVRYQFDLQLLEGIEHNMAAWHDSARGSRMKDLISRARLNLDGSAPHQAET